MSNEGSTAIFGVLFPTLTILIKYGCNRDFLNSFMLCFIPAIGIISFVALGFFSLADETGAALFGTIVMGIIVMNILFCLPVAHRFHVEGVPFINSLLNTLCPGIGVLISHGCSIEFLITLILTTWFLIPAIIYAHYVSLRQLYIQKLQGGQQTIMISLDGRVLP